ncbi:MAG: DMP19 family protein [Solirubrobacteraceae bacterium]
MPHLQKRGERRSVPERGNLRVSRPTFGDGTVMTDWRVPRVTAIGEELAWKAIERVHGEIQADDPRVHELTRGQRAAFALHWARGEVGNGGLHQLFANYTGAVVPDAIAGAGLVGDRSVTARRGFVVSRVHPWARGSGTRVFFGSSPVAAYSFPRVPKRTREDSNVRSCVPAECDEGLSCAVPGSRKIQGEHHHRLGVRRWDVVRFDLVPGESEVRVSASTSLHTVTMRTGDVVGHLDAETTARGVSLAVAVPWSRIELPVGSLHTGNPLYDREGQRRVDAEH